MNKKEHSKKGQEEVVLSLCEISFSEKKRLPALEKQIKKLNPQAIYIGSYFCSRFFLHTMKVEWIKELKASLEQSNRPIPLVLVIPIFSQGELKEGKEKIAALLQEPDLIQELVVNDVGMLSYLKNTRSIHLGRLFFKLKRDFRLKNTPLKHCQVEPSHYFSIPAECSIKGVEVEPLASSLSITKECPGEIVSIHDLCYVTTGRICELSGLGSEKDEKRFRPNKPCSLQCQTLVLYELDNHFKNGSHLEELNPIFIKAGRTIYWDPKEIKINAQEKQIRQIVFPWVEGKDYGDFSTTS